MRALVTGGGRGIGAGIARALAGDGWDVVVGARSRDQVTAVATEIGGEWVEIDVSDPTSVRRAMQSAGELDLLVANAGESGGQEPGPTWEIDPDAWWHVHEVNVRGVHLCCRAVIPGMLERGGRIVITGSGAAYLPGVEHTAYAASKAAVCRYGETLANELADRIPVFHFSPGLVRTEMTGGAAADDDLPWTPPELAPELVRRLATGRYDALAGRYLHAEHDDVDDLLARIDELRERDLNAIRLRR